MKYQALFSLKNIEKKIFRLLSPAVMTEALRIKTVMDHWRIYILFNSILSYQDDAKAMCNGTVLTVEKVSGSSPLA